MNPDTLNRLHQLRGMSQDLRREVERAAGFDGKWHVAVHLAACEQELTNAIALTAEGMKDEDEDAPDNDAPAIAPGYPCNVCQRLLKSPGVCLDCANAWLESKTPAVLTPATNQSRS